MGLGNLALMDLRSFVESGIPAAYTIEAAGKVCQSTLFNKEHRNKLMKIANSGADLGKSHLWESIISWARALLLKHCVNLRSLSVNGSGVGFPFCERVGTHSLPLPGLTSSLSILKIKRWGYSSPIITSGTLVRLLNLPNLTQVSVFISMDKED